jgi:hypothetical protein
MNPLIQLEKAIPLFLLALVCFTFSPTAQAVSPPPDGGYPGQNTAEGDNALLNLTDGVNNTAIGFNALLRDTIGSQNTATGFRALANNMGDQNTANGSEALSSNIGGTDNTAMGFQALFNNLSSQNTATGAEALLFNIYGGNNTANGFQALLSNRNGHENTATGLFALRSNIGGNHNTANGAFTMVKNTTGNANTGDGYNSLFNNTTGSRNIAVGVGSGSNLTTGDNNIDIGNQGMAGEARTIRIGEQGNQISTFIAGISGVAVTGTQVVVNANGKLGVAPSAARFKDDIKPMVKDSEAILALKPVTFCYKKEIDPAGTSQFGLVAEEVEKVNPALVVRDKEGKPYSVRYEQVNAMLLNEFLKEHRKGEQQDRKIEDLEGTVAKLQSMLQEQAAQIQKVSARVEASKPLPPLILSNQ